MLMVEDSGSLASVDAVSALSVDALSNVDAHQLVSDMNTGGHTKLIRLDRNQKRENRFWRKQRAREKKQRKWEEQVRKQEEEQQDIENAPNGRSTAEVESTDEQESSASDEDTNGDSAEIVPAIDEDVESSAFNENEEGLADSGYKAGGDAERNDEGGSENENLINLAGSDHDGAVNTNGRTDDGNSSSDDEEDSISQLSGHVNLAENDNYSVTENQDKDNVGESTAENSEIEDRVVSPTNEEESSVENGTRSAEYQPSEDDDREKHDEVEKKGRSIGKIESSDEEDEEGSKVKSESDDDDVVIDDFRLLAVEQPANEIDDSKQGVRNNSHEQDGYETDDERERVTEPQHDDENFPGDGDVDKVKEQGADIVDEMGGDEQSPSEWVGPRSVSPYMEQQRNSDDVGRSTPLPDSLNDSTAGRDSVFEGSEPATNGPGADRQDADGSSSQRATRPPSRISAIYTYASGTKVLSHVELAPEAEQQPQPQQTESDADVGDDKLNGKHVTFKDDVKAASSVRLRRRRLDVEDKMEEGVTHMKEIRKKNKERRKNRVSNSFRSSSTSGSLMNDKRLIKTGNIGTLVLHGQPQGGPSLTDIIRYQEARRRDADLNNSGSRRVGSTGRRRDERVRTPPAVAGRKHYRVQTEPYLEEIRDRRLEADAAVQTDPLMDRPSTPLFVPSKTGADVATQIYEGDLFDFELESAPILEVLVGKTVEQSLLEVMEEEELESLKQHQRRFQERRQAEVAEQQRLGERERRHVEEKDRRMAQGRIALQQEQETEAKVAASALAQNYLADMVPAVFSNLRQKGFFFNGVERDIETTFMPWLRDAVEQELDKVLNGREVLDELILDAVRKRRDELERRQSLTARLPPPPPVEPETAGEASEAGEEAEDEDEADEEGVDEDEEEDAAEEATTDDDVSPPVRSDTAADKPATGEEAANEQDEDDP